MLTVHHLGKSQSERIVWLCEELGIPYDLKRYERVAVTMLAPPEYKALHPLGAAPVITDGEQTKPSFATYPIAGMTGLDPAGVVIPSGSRHCASSGTWRRAESVSS